MTDEVKKRTSQDVQNDFNNTAFRAGHLQHDIYNKERDLKSFNEALVTLQLEYNKLKAQETDEAVKAAADQSVAAPEAEKVSS